MRFPPGEPRLHAPFPAPPGRRLYGKRHHIPEYYSAKRIRRRRHPCPLTLKSVPCSEQRRKVEEEYASAAYSQLLTFVELFEFYIGCQQPDLVVPLRIDECCNPLPDQTAPFRIVDNKMIAAVCIRTEDKNDCTWVPVSVKPISLVECFMEIGYGTDRVKQFHVNFSYGAIGIKQTSSDNALSYLEAMFKEEASFNPFHTKDDTNEIG